MQHSDQYLVDEFNRVFWGYCYKQYADKFDILKEFAHHNSYTIKIQKLNQVKVIIFGMLKLQIELMLIVY
jgi:hypothetical protein